MATSLKFLVNSNSFIIDSLGFSGYINISSANHIFACFFLICFWLALHRLALPIRREISEVIVAFLPRS